MSNTQMTINNFLKYMDERQFNYSVHISEKNKYIYFETPKVGCSTIKATLMKNEMNDSDLNLSMKLVHTKKDTPFLSPKQFGYDNFIKIMNSNEYYKFTFVRDPYSRVLSAYLSKFKRISHEKKEFYILNNIDSSLDISFSDFLEYLKHNVFYEMNPHWRPLYAQILGLSKHMDFIGRFENFNDDLSKIINNIFGNDSAALVDSRKELGQKETKSSEKLDVFYTQKEFDLVSEIYKKDFLEFDYNDSSKDYI